MLGKDTNDFHFAIGDVILAKYEKDVYYAQIVSIDYINKTANLLFDDGSKEDLSFQLIFSGKGTTCLPCHNFQTTF